MNIEITESGVEVDEDILQDQILSIMYQLKQQGIKEISSGDLLMLLGHDAGDIGDEQFDIMLSLPDNSDILAELSIARLNNQIH